MTYLKTLALGAALTLSALPGAMAHDYKAGDIVIGHPWTRATPPNAQVAGGYLTLTNGGQTEDRLVGGTSPVASSVEIHDMSVTDGVMMMRKLDDGLAVPPGETVALEPGALHLMLVGLKEPVAEGDRVPLTLTFESGATVEVELAAEAIGGTPGGKGEAEMDDMDHGAGAHDAHGGAQ